MSTVIRVNASHSYDVTVGCGLLDDAGGAVMRCCPSTGAAVISDDTVAGIYGERTQRSLRDAGYNVSSFTFVHGEASKNPTVFAQILSFLAQNRFTRTDPVIALGGGVTGDMAGFAAACYLRGVPFVQLPTTLLAAVDSSVGGKTAIDLPEGKNLAGAFYQPSLVLMDTKTLVTLPALTLLDGMAEAVKYGVIGDEALFARFEGGVLYDDDIIARCIRMKADIVGRDEFDEGERQLLNLGHTFGHAIEARSGFSVSHGKAVAIGMVMAARAAETFGIAETPCATRIKNTLAALGLPVSCPYSPEELAPFALNDKKRRASRITLILPKRIGECVRWEINADDALKWFIAGTEG